LVSRVAMNMEVSDSERAGQSGADKRRFTMILRLVPVRVTP